jgi:hypothetical protein
MPARTPCPSVIIHVLQRAKSRIFTGTFTHLIYAFEQLAVATVRAELAARESFSESSGP